MTQPSDAGLWRTMKSGLIGLVLCLSASAIAQQKGAGTWETLTCCTLVTNAAVDGDSFHVRHDGREYIFRLYFVDTPESDATLKERIVDQAAYFGISAEDIPRAGALAAQFTRATLAATNFTIITRWQNALGRSSLARFYGVVMLNDRNLAGELVACGYARIYGYRANWPDGPRSTTFLNQLKNYELTAREKKLGVWDESRFPRQTGTTSVAPPATNAPAAKALVNINHASLEELKKLPGIGQKLAERIIAHRPYKDVDDLDRVPGFGKATIARFKPFLTAEPESE